MSHHSVNLNPVRRFSYLDFCNIGISGAQVSAARCGLAQSAKAAAEAHISDSTFRLNFRAIREFAVGKHSNDGSRAVCVGSSRVGSDLAIWQMARNAGWLTETPRRAFSGREKAVDTLLTVKILEDILLSGVAPQNVEITIFSGDRDLLPAVQCLQRLGHRVCVASWAHSAADELRQTADQFIALDDYFQLIRYLH